MRTYRQGVAWLEYMDDHPAPEIRRGGMCQWYARNAWGAAPFGLTAYKAWLSIPYSHRHTGAPPPGSIYYWKGGSSGAGHACPVVENHKIWSTDQPYEGQTAKIDYTFIAQDWGLVPLGWIDWTPSGALPILFTVTPQPVVHVSRVQPGARNSEVLIVQKALHNEPQIALDYSSGPGIFGDRTKAAYRKWQQHLGFTGSDASGSPGLTSLVNLGRRHGFRAAD